MTLNEWAKEIHRNAVDHGWWDGDSAFGEIVALCHSELSEALEEYRNNRPSAYVILAEQEETERGFGKHATKIEEDPDKWGEHDKPEGIATEMVDCIIRILDWCGRENIDVDTILEKKHAYNKTRPYRHGGKAL